jgi:MoxR-like ATPase
MDHTKTYEKIAVLRQNLEQVIRGKRDVIDLAITVLIAKGHLLIEDVPGVGKTTLAHGLAKSINCSFQRIQFTSDLLPSDVIGVTVYNQAEHTFEFRTGPIFANVVLADEINRATPKTQSALLEAMSDRQVSVERATYELPRPFMLLATQNPLEFAGTFPLPESQLDRFALSLRIGYPDAADEVELIRSTPSAVILKKLRPVLSIEEVIRIQDTAAEVTVEEDLVGYILAIAHGTRHHKGIRLGVSPRGTMTLYRTAQAYALVAGRSYCTPDDIKRLAVGVFAHRIIPAGHVVDEDMGGAAALVEEILNGISVPV